MYYFFIFFLKICCLNLCFGTGDVNSIAIGEGSYIGDNAMVHCASEKGDFPTKIGNFVTVKSSAIIHGCILEDNVVVGLGSQVLDGAVMEKGSILSSGSILTGGKRIPAGQVWSGIPAKYVRDVTEEDMAAAQKDLEESIYSAELTALELSKSIEFRSSVEGMLTNKDYGYYFGIQKNPSAVDTVSYHSSLGYIHLLILFVCLIFFYFQENDQLRSADLYGHNVPGRLFETEGINYFVVFFSNSLYVIIYLLGL